MYKQKYLKYKLKYLQLKGGMEGAEELEIEKIDRNEIKIDRNEIEIEPEPKSKKPRFSPSKTLEQEEEEDDDDDDDDDEDDDDDNIVSQEFVLSPSKLATALKHNVSEETFIKRLPVIIDNEQIMETYFGTNLLRIYYNLEYEVHEKGAKKDVYYFETFIRDYKEKQAILSKVKTELKEAEKVLSNSTDNDLKIKVQEAQLKVQEAQLKVDKAKKLADYMTNYISKVKKILGLDENISLIISKVNDVISNPYIYNKLYELYSKELVTSGFNYFKYIHIPYIICNINNIKFTIEFAMRDLFTVIEKDSYNSTEIEDIIKQIYHGLRDLYIMGYLHLDIKPENILVYYNNDKFHINICDFDTLVKYNEKLPDRDKEKETYLFKDPTINDYHIGINPDASISYMTNDLFSLGITYYMLVVKTTPNPPTEHTCNYMYENIYNHGGDKELLKGLISFNLNERYSINKLDEIFVYEKIENRNEPSTAFELLPYIYDREEKNPAFVKLLPHIINRIDTSGDTVAWNNIKDICINIYKNILSTEPIAERPYQLLYKIEHNYDTFKLRDNLRLDDDIPLIISCVKTENLNNNIYDKMIEFIDESEPEKDLTHIHIPYLIINLINIQFTIELAIESLNNVNYKIIPQQIKDIIKQIYFGIRQLFFLDYVHLNLKPENILVYKNYNGELHINIYAFDSLNKIEEVNIYEIGTTGKYTDPYIISNGYYTGCEIDESTSYLTTDLFSLGIIYYELVTQTVPDVKNYNTESEKNLLYETLYNVMDTDKELLKGLISPNLDERYSISKLDDIFEFQED
jgi:serine/threonine protein kinase